MRKVIYLLVVLLVLSVFLLGCTTPEIDLSRKGPHGQAGKSNIAHLYLYEKTGEPDWDIVDDGAWGKMKYNLSGAEFEFVFNGHGLEIGLDYTLIYYPDYEGNPWPREGIICLGSGIVNEEGDVHIAASVDTGDLPADEDINADLDEPGAKIWLVLSDDVDCESEPTEMTGWNPTEYLFEYELITFNAEE